MNVFRMHRSVRAPSNRFGAMDTGGGWTIGTPMFYTAQHLSLACVEVLVHLDKSELPRDYAWSRADVDDELEYLSVSDLTTYGLASWLAIDGFARADSLRSWFRLL